MAWKEFPWRGLWLGAFTYFHTKGRLVAAWTWFDLQLFQSPLWVTFASAKEGVKIRCTTQAPLLRGVALEWGSGTLFRQKGPQQDTRVPRNWLAVDFVAKTTAFLSVHLQNNLSRAKVAFNFMAVCNSDERRASWMISLALAPTAPFSHHGYGE